jgi:hypothetical protein
MISLPSPKEKGILIAQLVNLSSQVIPRALTIHSRMKLGEKLTNRDLDYLRQNLRSVGRMLPTIDSYKDYQPIYAGLIYLLHEIIRIAVENESEHRTLLLT